LANANVNTSKITFASGLFTGGDQSITLTNFDTGLDSTEFGATAFIVSTPITINGPTGDNGLTIERDSIAANFRLFHVQASGDLTLDSLTLSGGLAMGGNGAPGSAQGGGGGGGLGGAVFNQGALQIHRSTLSGNVAIGGNGGALSGGATPNGGGGGVGADGYLYASGGPNGGPGGIAGGFGGGGAAGDASLYGSPGGFGGGGGAQAGPGTPVSGGFGGGGGAANYDGGPSFGGFGGGNGKVGSGSGGGGAGMGGAIFNQSGTVTITNSTLGLNSATGGTGNTNGQGLGGAVFTRNGSVTILNSTFSENTAAEGGGAIFAVSDSNSGTGFTGGNATVAINNTILANTAGGASDFAATTIGTGSNSFSGVGNLIESNAASGTHTGTIVSSADPMLAALADNGGPTQTFALLAGSPAIDAGDSVAGAAAGDFDQRGMGFDRVAGDVIDIGAIESSPASSTLTVVLTSNGRLKIDDGDATGKDNVLTVSTVGTNVVITDQNESFNPSDIVAITGAVLSNNNRTLTVPLSTITRSVEVNARLGSDQITVQATDVGALNISLTAEAISIEESLAAKNVTLIGDSIAIAANIQAPNGNVIATPVTHGVLVDLGGADAPGTLGLTDAEFDFIKTKFISIGNTTSGSVTISSDIDLTDGPNAEFLDLEPNGSVIGTAGGLKVSNLNVIANGEVTLTDADNAISTVCVTTLGSVTLTQAGDLTVAALGGLNLDSGINNTSGIDQVVDPNATSPVSLTSTAGTVTIESGGVISGGSITILAKGDVDIRSAGLQAIGTGGINASSMEGKVTVSEGGVTSNSNLIVSSKTGTSISGVGLNNTGGTSSLSVSSFDGLVEISGSGVRSNGGIFVVGTGGVTVSEAGISNTGGKDGVSIIATGGNVLIGGSGIASKGFISIAGGKDVTIGGAGVRNAEGKAGILLDSFGGKASISDDGVASSDRVLIRFSGDVSIAGKGVTNATGTGTLEVTSGGSVTLADTGLASSANVTITADKVAFGAPVNAGTATVAILPSKDAININLGTETTGSLSLTDAELDRITASKIEIGSAKSGAITISAALDQPAIHTLSLIGNTSFAANSGYTFGVGGTTAGTEFDQIQVMGTVNIAPTAALTLTAVNAFVPATTDTFTILLNDGDSDGVSGTFAGLPNNSALPIFLGPGTSGAIHYDGGNGNDIVLAARVPATTAVSLTNGALLIEDVAGGDSNDALTITLDRSNSANPIVRITDPNLQLGITGMIVGATLSTDGHTVTVPYNAVLSLHVLAQGGNDKLTLAAAGSGAFQREALIDAGAGNDTITLDSSLRGRFEGTLTANGDDGNDTLTAVAITGAGSFRVTFTGGNGDDTLTGGDKNDTLSAGLGNDVLYGLGGADLLDGGAGDDSLDGGASNDTLNGGTGIDRARRKNDVSFVVTNSELQELNGSTLISVDKLSGIETVSLTGGVSANRFDLSAFNNTSVALIEGGGGNDTVLGSEGTDSITTGSGIDVIDGRGGNDTIASGDGADVVQGGLGNDSISGDGGNDSLVGGAGADLLFGGSGKDTLTGNAGNDTLNGGTGSDMLSEAGDVNFTLTNSSLTGLGTDQISAFESALLIGGNGPNIIDASAATFSVLLNGGAGADILTGGSEDDSLNGGTGNDTLYGLGGQDLLFGSFGNDLLDGGASNDSLVGGDGIDAARRKNNTDFRVDNTGMFELLGTQVIATDTFNSIETVSITGGVSANRIDLSAFTNTGTATIQGSGGNDTVIGSDGLDVITTTSGADVIDGRGGADTILSGDGADSIHGGDGNDNLDGQGGNDTVLGDAGNDNLGGGAGSDQIDGGAGRNRLVENVEGNVTIVGTQLTSSVPGNNDSIQNVIAITLRGGTGNNLLDARLSSVPVQLQGNDGDDTLLGSSGRDLLQGGAGNDVLSGGDSIDTIDGGLGTDTFFESGSSDFAVTGVKIARGGGSTTESVSNIEGIVLIGGVGNNALDASRASVPVTLLGGAGNDMLAGGSLADVLIGGNRASSTNGLDTLNGLAGNDQFDNDPADTRTTDAGDQVLANIFAQLPSWIDAL
jgi:Ca2+-binding RTX toxin-like protein